MDSLNIEKFDPNIAELTKMVKSSEKLTASSDLAIVKDHRLVLKKARVDITRKGKELREEALSFQRAVIAKEKELIAIIEPEEERLEQIEEEAKERALREERKVLLPDRRAQLEGIGIDVAISDEQICSLDSQDFQAYVNDLVARKNEADRLALEERERAAKEKEDALNREAEMRDREEKARQEERARLEREQKEKEERLAREEKERKEAEERARIAEEEKKKREEEEREKNEKYNAWLSEYGYTKDHTELLLKQEMVNGKTKMVLYKKISEYEL